MTQPKALPGLRRMDRPWEGVLGAERRLWSGAHGRTTRTTLGSSAEFGGCCSALVWEVTGAREHQVQTPGPATGSQ